MRRVDPITHLLHEAVRDKVFPGAVLMVRAHGQVVYHQAVGQMGHSPYDRPAHVGTIYDLASLTKPLATTTAILCLLQEGKLGLDQPMKTWLNEWEATAYQHTTVRQLLHHSSGLPAWRQYYERLDPAGRPPHNERERQTRIEAILRMIAAEPMEYKPGSRSMYSDLGFIGLGIMIERCAGSSLADYCRQRMYGPLNSNPLFFINANGMPSGGKGELIDVAPTEQDPWRGRLVHAAVHDEHAYALGGFTGHAGLFGTALSVSHISEAWLQAVSGRSSMLPASLAQQFIRRQDLSGSSGWALGWDTPSSPSSSGRYFTQESFGHLGYTGTSLWIDPVRELEVILLSNRVHPTRKHKQITLFRPKIHDLVVNEFSQSTE